MWQSVPPETMRRPRSLQHLREHARVLEHALLVDLEVVPQRLAERDGLGRDDVHQRAALQAREHGGVDRLLVLGLARG